MESPAYTEYETLLRRLHEYIARGQGDSAEADAIRERMDGPERHLTAAEMARLDELSADLNAADNDE